MGKHDIVQKIVPVHMDRDSDAKVIKSEDGSYRYALNSRSGSVDDGTQGIFENIRGNILIPNDTLPSSGTNKCIGCKEDIRNNRLFFFNWNSEGRHGVYVYMPELTGRQIHPIYLDTPDNKVLDFSEHMEINNETMVSVVDGKYLVFTDGYNPQRFIDIEKGLNYNKKKQWELNAYDDTLQFTLNINGVLIPNLPLDDLATNTQILANFDVEICDCKVTFTEKIVGDISLFTTTNGRLVPLNFYPETHNERQIDYILYPPNTAPQVTLKYDSKYNRNLISGTTWQFRIKYNYKGGFSSVWSPWSKMVSTAENQSQFFNNIEIDYTAKIFNELNMVDQLYMIESVELGYRNTNAGKLYSFVTIKQCDIPMNEQKYNFYNDVNAQAQSDVDNIKAYDAVPLTAGALCLTGDRMVQGDCIENYDVDCVDYEVKVDFTPAEKIKVGSIKGRIFLHNYGAMTHDNQPLDNKAGLNQPICIYDGETPVFGGFNGVISKNTAEVGQLLPDAGFYVSLLGTDFYTKSKQIRVPNVDIFDQSNNVINLKDNAQKIKLFEYIDNGGKIYSEYQFDNIPVGKYILGIASHLCSVDDKLGKGAYYNVDSTNKFQRTSTYTMDFVPNGEVRQSYGRANKLAGKKQIVVEVTEGGITVVEDAIIEDLSSPVDGLYRYARVIDGYVYDSAKVNAGVVSTNQNDIKAGSFIEQCFVEYKYKTSGVASHKASPNTLVCRSDHNGFFYTTFINDDLNISNGKGGYIDVKIDSESINNRNDVIYQCNLNDIFNTTVPALNGGNNDINYDADTQHSFIIPNTSVNVVNDYRTNIKGKLLSTAGVPLKGFTAVCTDTNRKVETRDDGSYTILVYRPHGANNKAGSLLFFDKLGTVTTTITEQTFDINPFIPNYSNAVPYLLPDIQITVQLLDTLKYYLKSGGVYDFAFSFSDRGNRKTTTKFNEKKGRLRIPFITEKISDYFPYLTTDVNGNALPADAKADGYFTATITLKDKPPVWCTHAYVERSQDQVYADFVQFVVSNVKYVERYDSINDEPIVVSPGSGSATEIYLDLGTSFTEYKNRNSNSAKGWVFEKGDRLRLMYKKNGQVRDFFEAEIKGQRGEFLIIENSSSVPTIEAGEIVEVFRSKQKLENIPFYETGEYYKVLNPYTPARAWETDTIRLNTGDAYRRNRRMYQCLKEKVDDVTTVTLQNVYTANIEDPSTFDSLNGRDSDAGRIDLINETVKQVRRGAIIRFSGQYINDVNKNKLRNYDALDYVESNHDYGRITVLSDFQDLLFVAQEKRCSSRQIQKSIVSLGADNTNLIANPNRFLDLPYYLDEEIGCTNPESFAKTHDYAKFLDAKRGCIGQYSRQNGLVNVSGHDSRYEGSKLMDKEFLRIPGILKNIDPDYVKTHFRAYGGYDAKNKEYQISFTELRLPDSTDKIAYAGQGANIGEKDNQFLSYPKKSTTGQVVIEPFTAVYPDKITFWTGYRSYIPERYGAISRGYVAFKDGNLWSMEVSDLYNHFFGQQYKQRLSVIMNQDASVIKDFLNWSLETDTEWYVYNVTIPKNKSLMREQRSMVPVQLNQGFERGYFGYFLKDSNTPNIANPLIEGLDLAGETLLFEIENESSEKAQLFAINLYAQYVPRSFF